MNATKRGRELERALDPFRELAMFEGCELTQPESPRPDGDTPLHVIAMDGRLDQLNALLPFVKEIDVKGDLGNSPLHYAVIWEQVDVALALIRAGADLTIENEFGDTPQSLVSESSIFSVYRHLFLADPPDMG